MIRRSLRRPWPALLAVPVWLGPWMIDPAPPAGLLVTRPPGDTPGATLRLAPQGDAPISGNVSATFDFVDQPFDGGSLLAELSAPATAVQAQLRVDDQWLVNLAAGPTATAAFGPGRRLTLAVQLQGAAPQGWHLTLRGLQFQQHGWRLIYGHDAQGLRVRARAADALVLGADPDWAELGWPVAGSVAASRLLTGQRVRGQLHSALPAQGLKALVSLDDVPHLAAANGAFALPLGGARRFGLSLHAAAAQPADAAWQVELSQLQVDDAASAGGCAVRGAATPAATSALALAVAAVASWRRRFKRSRA